MRGIENKWIVLVGIFGGVIAYLFCASLEQISGLRVVVYALAGVSFGHLFWEVLIEMMKRHSKKTYGVSSIIRDDEETLSRWKKLSRKSVLKMAKELNEASEETDYVWSDDTLVMREGEKIIIFKVAGEIDAADLEGVKV